MSRVVRYSQEKKISNKKNISPSPSEIEDNYRIITENLVYIIGLSESIADRNTLIKFEYLGQYGKILKIVINKKKAYHQNSKYGPSYSAYITYSKPNEASIAILSLDDTIVDNHLIRASFGTTKYCQFYLKNVPCNNKDCVFLHRKAKENEIIKRNELISNKVLFYKQQLYAMELGDIFNPLVKKQLMTFKEKNIKTMFPSPDLIYKSKIVIENDPSRKERLRNKKVNNYIMEKEKKNEKEKEKDNKEKLDISIKERPKLNPIKLNELESSISTNSNSLCLTSSIRSSISSDNIVNSNSNSTSKIVLNDLCNFSEKSRFDFAKNDCNNSYGVVLPNFIRKINEKACKLMKITNYFKNEYFIDDKFLFNDELNECVNNSNENLDNSLDWKNYICDSYKLNNKSLKYNKDDLIKDFDKINKFILKKAI